MTSGFVVQTLEMIKFSVDGALIRVRFGVRFPEEPLTNSLKFAAAAARR